MNFGGTMQGHPPVAESVHAERLRDLARRCRELSELTVIPDVSRELISIARALDNEAEQAERR